MKNILFLFSCFPLFSASTSAQINDALRFFPKGTRVYNNISYAQDTLERHRLDVYLPADTGKNHPVIFWIHSGGWRAGDKQGDMHYMHNTLNVLMKNGYAIVATNYRFSTTAIFPAQIQDCNRALEFVYENAGKYKLDTTRIALMGFSAGGHLAALMGLSANNDISDFYFDGKKPGFKISAVIDFYGLSDFWLIPPAEYRNSKNGPGLLFGAAMNDKQDLVKQATPLTYIERGDPPFLIIHGKKDELMDVHQSITLNDSLKAHGVITKLMLINDAPHGGEMFDTKPVWASVILFLNNNLK